MKEVSFFENRLIIDGLEVRFRYNIKQFVEFDNAVVVRLEMKARDDDINNVYGVVDGKIAWRVQDMLEYDKNCAPFVPDPYTGIRVYEKDRNIIVATTFQGFRFLINPHNGRIIGTESWVK